MADPTPKSRRYRLTPDRLIFGLLAVEGLLWLSDRLGWPVWHRGYAVLATVATVGVAFLAMLLWFAVALIFRWRFQFSLRSLLVLVVVVAIPCSWLAVEMKKATEQREAVEAIAKLGGVEGYDWQFDKDGHHLPNTGPPEPTWLLIWLGDDFFAAVVSAQFTDRPITDIDLAQLRGFKHLRTLDLDRTNITDAGLEHIARLPQLQKLGLEFTQVTEVGLAHIAKLPQLKWLDLNGTKVTDAGLEHLKGLSKLQGLGLDGTKVTNTGLRHIAEMTRLQELWLTDTKVTDEGLAHIAGMTQLETLALDGTNITDSGLAHLDRLAQLQWLRLEGTQVTDEGVKKLKHALPKCRIVGP
jgi:Leucine-rich repeat (LRR) protein